MVDDSPSGRYTRLMVRISEELRSKLEASALSGGRSLSAEMLLRIEKSFEDDVAAEALSEAVAEHETRIADLERRMEDVFHLAGWRDFPENQSD